ncbi:COX2 oxidase, partial [Acromyrmex heyeri]
DFTIIILTFITTLILFIIFKSLSNKFINLFLLEHHIIEIIVLSINFPIRILTTSIDVIYYGIFFGHCSEICGINYSFVPIIEATNLINFKI